MALTLVLFIISFFIIMLGTALGAMGVITILRGVEDAQVLFIIGIGPGLLMIGVLTIWKPLSWIECAAGDAAPKIDRGMCAVISLLFFIIITGLREHRHEDHRRLSCQSRMRELGLVLKTYGVNNSDLLLPILSREPGRLMFENSTVGIPPIFPEILTDLTLFYCSSASGPISSEGLTPKLAMDDHTFFYLGYAIRNQAELEAFSEAYKLVIATDASFNAELTGVGGEAVTLHRIRFLTDPETAEFDQLDGSAHIPVLIERPGNHIPRGSNILYADGHVEFIKYGEAWPVTDRAMDVFLELDALGAS